MILNMYDVIINLRLRRSPMTTQPPFSQHPRRLHGDWALVYADRSRSRGHDLSWWPAPCPAMEALAEGMRRETGVTVDILQSYWTDASRGPLEARLYATTLRIAYLVKYRRISAAVIRFLDLEARTGGRDTSPHPRH